LSNASKSAGNFRHVARVEIDSNGKFSVFKTNPSLENQIRERRRKMKISIFYGRNPFKSDADDGAFERTVMRPFLNLAALIIRRILIKIFVHITKTFGHRMAF
jgi:hypothetical protein